MYLLLMYLALVVFDYALERAYMEEEMMLLAMVSTRATRASWEHFLAGLEMECLFSCPSAEMRRFLFVFFPMFMNNNIP